MQVHDKLSHPEFFRFLSEISITGLHSPQIINNEVQNLTKAFYSVKTSSQRFLLNRIYNKVVDY